MAGWARFIQDDDEDPAKAESWSLTSTESGQTLSLGWRKGSRWIAISHPDDGTTSVFQMTREQMRQLAEIAERI